MREISKNIRYLNTEKMFLTFKMSIFLIFHTKMYISVSRIVFMTIINIFTQFYYLSNIKKHIRYISLIHKHALHKYQQNLNKFI